MKVFIALLLFVLIFIGFFHPISAITQDLGRHLITGEIILKTHSIPKINLFSYTFPNFPFINHHWLTEVFYSHLFQAAGFNSLLILNTILVILSFGLVIASIYRKTGALALSFCSLLFIPILFERTDVRPEFFSFLFLSLFIVILYKFREKYTRLIFLLPFIELLWTNVHIYFPIGIALIIIFFVDYLILNRNHFNYKYIGIFAVILSLSLLSTLFNPNGLKGALYPLSVFQNYGYSIQENQNIFFLWNYSHNPAILFFGISAIFLFLILILARKKTCPADWLISISFSILAMTAIRNFPLFIFATFIPFARSLSNIHFTFPKHIKTIFLVFLLALFVFEAQWIYAKKGFGMGTETGAKEGVDFFLKNNLKGPIFNNFDIGSYLIYRLYPKEKVFVDGRPEAYPASFFKEEYIPMQEKSDIFETADRKYNFNTIFFSHTDQTPWAEKFIKQITENKKWNLVYLDDFSAIWTKDGNIKSTINIDYSNIKSLIQLAHFFQNTKLADQEINIYQKILSIDPKSCPALYNLALKLQEKQNPSSPIFLSKFQNNCQ